MDQGLCKTAKRTLDINWMSESDGIGFNVFTNRANICWHQYSPLMARFMGPTWGPSGEDRTQVGPMLAQWALLCLVMQMQQMFYSVDTYSRLSGTCFCVRSVNWFHRWTIYFHIKTITYRGVLPRQHRVWWYFCRKMSNPVYMGSAIHFRDDLVRGIVYNHVQIRTLVCIDFGSSSIVAYYANGCIKPFDNL